MDKLYNTQQGPRRIDFITNTKQLQEKKKENDSKNRSLPHLGCDVGLEPTTPRTTIWCSTN